MKEIEFETSPSEYVHWTLAVDGPVAKLAMNVQEDRPYNGDYVLKLNSYDIGVDIELADAIERIRFEHPQVKVVEVTSSKDRVFCSGANIYMLGTSTHGFKVNFCKFTNETRLGMENASKESGLHFLCSINGPCAGGGYELALACDEIWLIDDGNSAVSLPEVPLLGVLPGTGGLTRVVDKRHVRRDLADFFSTVAEGIKGKRAKSWGLVDEIAPRSKFAEKVNARIDELVRNSKKKDASGSVHLTPIQLKEESDGDRWLYDYVSVAINRQDRMAEVELRTPKEPPPSDLAAIEAQGASYWPFAMFRQLDRALLRLRFNEPEVGTIVFRTKGSSDCVRAVDHLLHEYREHWFMTEMRSYMGRVLRRLDMTARSLIAAVEPGSCFVGSLYEVALACDRIYMLDDMDNPNQIQLSVANEGAFLMGNGLSRLESRFYGDDESLKKALSEKDTIDALAALDLGLVTFAPDDIDWEDELRLAVEERVSLSPDALTGMEANLRFVGPETMETKIFGRLTAWQNWIFQRPNAVGEKGALKVYGMAGARPEFDWRRT